MLFRSCVLANFFFAEDDVANAKFLSKYLSKLGEVVITPDGIAAVDEFVKHLEKGENIVLSN